MMTLISGWCLLSIEFLCYLTGNLPREKWMSPELLENSNFTSHSDM